MSWLFSRALVEASGVDISSDGEPSAPSNSTPTPQVYWSPGRTTERCPPSRYGMTSERLTDVRGEAVLTWSLEDSRARTSALPAVEQDWAENVPDSGARWRASFARWDPDTFSWRTPQLSLFVE